ncbi:MAG: CoA transferase [Tepidiformaceae bacterium]
MADGALSDVVVLELATGAAGPYAGKLLADLGAQVVKVEPEGGDALRAEPPLHGGESAFFNYLSGNKLGASMSTSDARIEELAGHADIILHSLRGEDADALEARLGAVRPSAVVVSLSPYGRSGWRSRWNPSPLTEWATSGFQFIAGDPERAPLALPGFQAEYHAGLHAAVAALAGLWHARETGEGQRIEISHQEACLSDHAWLTTMWTHTGQVQRRTGALYAKCLDGHVYMFNLAPYPNLFVLMERYDLLADEELLEPLNWMARFPEVFAALSQWAATRTRQEIYHAAQELRIAVSPVNTMADVASNAQLASREWFTQVEVGGARFRAPGFPYRLSETPCEARFPAPKLGEHTDALGDSGFGWANADAPAPRRTALRTEGAPGGALNGLRLIEVTANWAGPIGGRHFADLGADVIKIELQTKPATRALIYVGDDVTWPDAWHRSGYFNKLNRNKRAVALDLSKPLGRELFLKLVAEADCVLENNAARVMGQLGLGYEQLREANPALVMCSMSGFGSTGPERNYSAYGSNIETTSGLASLLGYAPGDAFGTGSYYADPVTGNHGAVAMLAALHARRRTGRGQWVDMALLEAVSPFFAQQFLEYTVSGHLPEAQGDQWGRHAFQAVVPSAGKDCWISVTCRDEEELERLRIFLGEKSPDLAALRRALELWCSEHDHNLAADMFQSEGVAAGPVMANWEIFTDNHLNDRQFFQTVRHEVAGTFQQPGFPWRFERTPAAIRMAAPMFGEHNFEVFRDLLGLSREEFFSLYEHDVTGDDPIYASGPAI